MRGIYIDSDGEATGLVALVAHVDSNGHIGSGSRITATSQGQRERRNQSQQESETEQFHRILLGCVAWLG
jgi:hypothetical protein